MALRKAALPDALHDAWWAFVDCAEVVEGGRRALLATLPAGRVEPAPVALGVDGLTSALSDARAWMPAWKIDALLDDWSECLAALDQAEAGVALVREVAATTTELEQLLGAVQDVIAPLDAFADAERAWRRHWRIPRQRRD